MLSTVLAHVGGWDELVLLFMLPPVVFLIAYRMTRAGSEMENHDDPEGELRSRT